MGGCQIDLGGVAVVVIDSMWERLLKRDGRLKNMDDRESKIDIDQKVNIIL